MGCAPTKWAGPKKGSKTVHTVCNAAPLAASSSAEEAVFGPFTIALAPAAVAVALDPEGKDFLAGVDGHIIKREAFLQKNYKNSRMNTR